MGQSVHIIVTCANRKSLPVPPELMLRSALGRTYAERAADWTTRLERTEAERLPAKVLYLGDHWAIARALPQAAASAGLDARLWVCSAGYGLVSEAALLRPYSATFSAGHADSVPSGASGEGLSHWWNLLAAWQGPEPGTPRTLEQLASLDPAASMMVIASTPYLRALTPDLGRVAKCLRSPENLVLVSAGHEKLALNGLSPHLLPCDGRMQALVGGALQSLNVRLAREALRGAARVPLRLSALKEHFASLLEKQPDLPKYERVPMTDDEVCAFVENALDEDPRATKSALLRQFRASGRACEQSRFFQLFQEVKVARGP